MNDSPKPPIYLDYLRLFRLPNVFTAVADIIMGWLFAGGFGAWSQDGVTIGRFIVAMLASASLYTAGMVLNDVFDVEIDRKERPNRPLPSGRISMFAANAWGWGLLLAGLILAAATLFMHGGDYSLASFVQWRVLVVALLLAGCIVGYNAGAKLTPLGPLVMGACRFFNVLLGISAAGFSLETGGEGAKLSIWLLAFTPAEFSVAAGIGVYIVGVTIFAKNEAEEQSGTMLLALGLVVMLAGYGLLAWFPQAAGGAERLALPGQWWLILIGLLAATMLRRSLTTLMNPSPQAVQGAIKQFIFSLIMLDASVCMAVGQLWWGVAVVALLAPMLLLGRWVYST